MKISEVSDEDLHAWYEGANAWWAGIDRSNNPYLTIRDSESGRVEKALVWVSAWDNIDSIEMLGE